MLRCQDYVIIIISFLSKVIYLRRLAVASLFIYDTKSKVFTYFVTSHDLHVLKRIFERINVIQIKQIYD